MTSQTWEPTWEQAAADALGRLRDSYDGYQPFPTAEAARTFMFSALNPWPGVYATVANHVNVDKVLALLAEKHHDYGTANHTLQGVEAIKVRVIDKFARIETLTARDSGGVTEPLQDAWDDIAGYCVIARMLIDGTFELPLAADVVAGTSEGEVKGDEDEDEFDQWVAQGEVLAALARRVGDMIATHTSGDLVPSLTSRDGNGSVFVRVA